MFKEWLEIQEPDWYLSETSGIKRDSTNYYMINIGVLTKWLGYIDGPRTDNHLVVRVGAVGAGSLDVDLMEPGSFEKIHTFLKERLPK